MYTDKKIIFPVSARRGFVTAMFVIFLGIIPVIAVLALLSYYAKHNLRLTWKKPAAPYVTNCVSSSWQHVISACKGVGTVFSNQHINIPTVSHKVSNERNNIEIKHSGLVSTTNCDGINRSNTIVAGDGCRSAASSATGRISFINNIKAVKSKASSSAAAQPHNLISKNGFENINVKDLSKKFNNADC